MSSTPTSPVIDATEYPFAQIERDTQAYWAEHQSFRTEDTVKPQDKFYCLAMFPYPSGKLHMGHVRNYTLADVIARFQALQGKQVLHPMGWDAFGLPAENAARLHHCAPADWTKRNIDDMRGQLQRLGFSYDWSREIATCHPDYYRWEQWFFIQLYKKGLVYRKQSIVNWDPIDQTVLANEQVIDGKGWRSGAPVERREIPQWFLKITDYADELLEDLTQLTEWPEQVRTMQANWIGRSQGLALDFAVLDNDNDNDQKQAQALNVYTTRPDTLMGLTYLAIAAKHPLALQAAQHSSDIQAFIQSCDLGKVAEADLATAAKRGINTGLFARHPLTQEKLPIWIANFVLMEYGSGAVMCVPAHDQRDWEFAKAYQLPMQAVIRPADHIDVDITEAAFTEKGVLFNSGVFDGLTSAQAFDRIADQLSQQGVAKRQTHYRLRDWGVSRQRYWGTPIPMIYCQQCGTVPVPEADLPVVLPTNIQMDDSGRSPLHTDVNFFQVNCPTCQQPARRETDTFDTFMESSWYYARFTAAREPSAMLTPSANDWLPVDHYVGGIEHAVLHLLYARFFHKLMRDLGLVSSDEPFKRLLCQGMVVSDTFYRTDADGKRTYFYPHEVTLTRDDKGRPVQAQLINDAQPVQMGGIEKMSKSKNNGVDPQQLIDRYGADTVRLFILFAAPPDQSLEWSEAGVEGAHRFLKRLWRQVQLHQQQAQHHSASNLPSPADAAQNTELKEVRRKIHSTLQKAADDLGRRLTFNTAIAGVMELFNVLQKLEGQDANTCSIRQEGLEIIVLILAPITPHIGHVLWQQLGHNKPLHQTPWRSADASALLTDSINWAIQINGKLRGQLSTALHIAEADLITQAKAVPSVAKFLENQTVVKSIVVANKLVNLVVKPS